MVDDTMERMVVRMPWRMEKASGRRSESQSVDLMDAANVDRCRVHDEGAVQPREYYGTGKTCWRFLHTG